MPPERLPIRYPPHAAARMQSRGVSKAQVERAIRKHDQKRLQNNRRWRFEKALSRRNRLVVIAEEHAQSLVVITVFSRGR